MDHSSTPTGRRAARPDPGHADPHGRRLRRGRHHRRPGRHPPGRARPSRSKIGEPSRRHRCAPPRTSCRASPPSCSATWATSPWWSGLHWGFSLLPALIILSIMVIPYIAKTTENSLRQVPTGYREGAEALGMSDGLLAAQGRAQERPARASSPGLLLALAIACGETAPLIYTAGFSNTLPHSLTHAAVPLPDLRRLHVLQRARRRRRTTSPTTPR